MAKRPILSCVTALCLMPVLMGAEGGCNGTAFSKTPAPDMSGDWNVAYDDGLSVEISIGGATYTNELGVNGGVINITHEDQPLSFDVPCDNEDVVCPSEVWPTEVSFRQDNARFPHRVFLQVPKTECSGALVEPDTETCGEGTNNPDCEMVCDGEVTTVVREAFGTIDEPGETFDVLLGGGVATNGINCILLGISTAHGDLVTTGSADDEDWFVTDVENGEVVTAYSGGCLWADDVDMDQELEALVLGASVKLTTGYLATR